MGMDSVELVLRFEEAFGVELKDEEVTDAVTPRMVVDLIFAKLKGADDCRCRSQRAFHILRRTLMQTFGLPRKHITPDMSLRGYFLQSQEKQMWDRVGDALAARDWPELVRPRWMTWHLTVCGFMVFGATVTIAVHSFRHAGRLRDLIPLSALGGLILVGLFGIVAGRVTRSFRIYIPASIKSIRDVVPYAVTSARLDGWSRNEVSAVVKRLVIEQLGLDESEYTEDSRFVEDFRLD